MGNRMQQLYLGVEIGGTKQQIAVCDAQGQVIDMVSEKVAHENGAADILDWLERKIPQLLLQYPDIESIGVGFGGPLETETGRVLISVQVPGWKDFKLRCWFEESFGMKTTVVVDTVAGGYAELMLGSGRDSDKFFYTNIGTGIGGSLFINGYTWDGIGYGASYLGNTYIADWTASESGAVTRIESLCGGVSIEKRLRTPGYIPPESMLMALCDGEVLKVDCRMVRQAAEEGDTFALEELDRVGHSFGIGLANTISMLGVDRISIGGGLANLGKWILEPIQKYADQYVFISGKERYQIVICSLMDYNVPIGAALYARDGFKTL